MYKDDLALNNLQWLICPQTRPDQTKKLSVINTISIPFFLFPLYQILSISQDPFLFPPTFHLLYPSLFAFTSHSL